MTAAAAPDSITLALWATNLARPLSGLADWAAALERKLEEASAAGAELLLLPEYAAEQWLAFKPAGLKPEEEIAWMASQAPAALELLRPLAARHGLALLAGTMPWRSGSGFVNRAWLLLPDGRCIAQDKLVLTPSEKDPAGWFVTPGRKLQLVEWRGLRLATLICLDVEMPALSLLLGPSRPDLLLVPSMTHRRSGHARVFGCAKARAIELVAAVAAVGCIGAAPGTTGNFSNVSGAALYLPCEPELGYDGVGASLGPFEAVEGEGPLLIARDLPLSTLRRLREGKAEVWPGTWSAEGVEVVTSPEALPVE